ncbi:MAG: PAS domain S-box protein [Thermoleophilia bacterium]
MLTASFALATTVNAQSAILAPTFNGWLLGGATALMLGAVLLSPGHGYEGGTADRAGAVVALAAWSLVLWSSVRRLRAPARSRQFPPWRREGVLRAAAPTLATLALLGLLVALADRRSLVGTFAIVSVGALALRAALVRQVQARLLAELEAHRVTRESLLASAGDGILGLDRDGRTVFLNERAHELLGHAAEEIVGRNGHELWHHSHADGTPYPSTECRIRQALEERRRIEVRDEVFHRADGSSFPVEYAAAPTLVGDEATGIVVTFRDVTERREADEALRRRDAMLDAVASAAESLLASAELDGAIAAVVEALGRAAGADAAELLEIGHDDAGPTVVARHGWSAADDAPPLLSTGDSWPRAGLGRWCRLLGAGGVIEGRIRDFPREERDLLEGRGVRAMLAVGICVDGAWWGTITLEDHATERPWSIGEIDALWTAARMIGAAVERARAEREVALANGRYEALIAASPVALMLLDGDGTMVTYNPASERLFGWTAEEAAATPLLHVPDSERAGLKERWSRVAETGVPESFEAVRRRRDGSLIDVGISLARVELPDSRPGLLAVIDDITQRKRAELEREHFLGLSADLLLVMDVDGRLISVSASFERVLGWPLNDLAGKPIVDLVHPDDISVANAALARIVAEGCGVVELRLLRSDGSFRWIVFSASAAVDRGRIYAAGHDVTERRMSEEELQDRSERLRAVVDTAAEGILTIDEHGTIESVNRAAGELFGYAPDELIGQNVSLLMPSPHREQHDDYMRRYRETGEARVIGLGREAEGLHRNGTIIPVELAVSELRAPGRRLFTGIVRDISDRRSAESAREQMLAAQRDQVERLQELDRLKDQFVSTVSHELRTPLTSILGYLQLLRETASEEDAALLEVVERNSRRLLALVGDLLFVAQVDSGALAFERRPVDLVRIVEECLAAARPSAAAQCVELEAELETTEDLWGDATRMAQLLDKLVANAVKATPVGGRVTVRVVDEGPRVAVEVEDTGTGIPEDELERIFDRFARTRASVEGAAQGSGLGLSIVKAIAEAHGGQVTVRSAPGIGSTFRVTFPRRLARRGADARAA